MWPGGHLLKTRSCWHVLNLTTLFPSYCNEKESAVLKWRNAVPAVLGNCQCNNSCRSAQCTAVAWQKVAEDTAIKIFVDLVRSRKYWELLLLRSLYLSKRVILQLLRLLRNFLAKETNACSRTLANESLCFMLSLCYERTVETRQGLRDVFLSVRPSICLIFYRIAGLWDGRGMWHVWRKGEVCTRFWWGNMRERGHWADQDVDGKIILKWTFRKWEGVMGTGWSWLRIRTGGGRLWVR